MPHACGALDGPVDVLTTAVVCISTTNLLDADYKFLWIDVGGYGHMSDAQIFNVSELKECLDNNSIAFPALPNDYIPTPYFILGDDAFGLRTYLMKPYAQRQMTQDQRIFNYRLSRGRRIAENAFGILAQRWQIFLTTMQQDPITIAIIIETYVILHHLMGLRYPAIQWTKKMPTTKLFLVHGAPMQLCMMWTI